MTFWQSGSVTRDSGIPGRRIINIYGRGSIGPVRGGGQSACAQGEEAGGFWEHASAGMPGAKGACLAKTRAQKKPPEPWETSGGICIVVARGRFELSTLRV